MFQNSIYLPLISLQYSEVNVDFTLKPYEDLYTVNTLVNNNLYRVKCTQQGTNTDLLSNN